MGNFDHKQFTNNKGIVIKVITEDEAIAQGADDFDIALGFMEGYITPTQPHLTPLEKAHGNIVARRMDPYYDVTIYEDGYEDYYPIGD